MKSERFVKLLDYMIDVTAVLGSFSREFQNEDLFITDLICKIEKADIKLEDLKRKGGVLQILLQQL